MGSDRMKALLQGGGGLGRASTSFVPPKPARQAPPDPLPTSAVAAGPTAEDHGHVPDVAKSGEPVPLPTAQPDPSAEPPETGEPIVSTPEPALTPIQEKPKPQPRRTPGQVADAISKILGDQDLVIQERGRPTPVSFDSSLDSWLFECVKAKRMLGIKTTASDLIREALQIPLPAEVASNGKSILATRHKRFGTVRTSVALTPSIISELTVEMGRYSNRTNALSVTALVELRVLHWASTQPNWAD